MEENILWWVIGGVGLYFVMNRLLSQWLFNRAVNASYKKEIEKILTGDEHKVRGKFE